MMTDLSGAFSRLDQVVRDWDAMIDNAGRIEAVRRVRVHEKAFTAELQAMTEEACELIGVPLAAVTLLDERYSVLLGICGGQYDPEHHPRDQSFCQYVAGTGHPFAVEDATRNPLVRHLTPVHDKYAPVLAYYGSPIFSPDHWPLGSFCIADTSPRRWNTAEMVLVDAFAAKATAMFAELP